MTPGLALLAVIVLALLAAGAAVAREQRARGCETSAPAASRPSALDERAILWAIRQRESGDNPRAIGKRYGERSAYQFMKGTWGGLTRAPFAEATNNPTLAHSVARKHLAHIRGVLEARNLDRNSPELIAAAWNFGPSFGLRAARSDYARAVAALYWDALKKKGTA